MHQKSIRHRVKFWVKSYTKINLILFYLIALTFLLHLPMENTAHSALFLGLAFVGQLGLLFFLWLIPVWLLQWLYPRRYLVGVCTLLVALLQLILIIDTFVFSSFHFHLNLIMLKVVFGINMVEFFGLNTFETIMAYSLAVLVFALEIVLAMWLWKKTPSLKFITRLRMWLILIVVLSCLIVAECFYAFAYAFGHEIILQNSRALPAFSGMQANNFLLKTHFLTVKEIESKSWENIAGHGSNGALYYPRHALHFTRQASPPNIVILGIDAWREDTMQQKIVPNIYNFSLKTARFYQHYSGGNCTLAGLYTLFYSIPSTYWKATTVPPALFDVLQQYHYRQGVFFSAGMAYPPFYRNIFLTVKGMQINIPGAEPYIRDNTITNDGLAFLDKYKTNKKPFFMFMFYDAAHSYSLSPNFKKPFQPIGAVDHADENNNTNPTPIFNVYKNALYYDDHLIGKVLAKIKAMHLYRNTIVIVTSDHGEEFNDNHHDYWGHTSNFTQYQTHIPLMIYVPGQKPQQIHYKTNHYDVMPTLLKDVFKVQNPVSDYSIGTNLFSGKPWKILPVGSYSYEGLIAPPYIYRFYPLGVTSVYDMHANIQKSFPTDALALKQYMQDISLFSRKA